MPGDFDFAEVIEQAQASVMARAEREAERQGITVDQLWEKQRLADEADARHDRAGGRAGHDDEQDDREAYSTLNMGAGFAIFVAPEDAARTVEIARAQGIAVEVTRFPLDDLDRATKHGDLVEGGLADVV